MLKLYIIFGLISMFTLFFANHSFADWPNLRNRNIERQAELRPRLDQIRKEHPRIFCRAEDFPGIRQRAETIPEINEVYSWLLDWAR